MWYKSSDKNQSFSEEGAGPCDIGSAGLVTKTAGEELWPALDGDSWARPAARA